MTATGAGVLRKAIRAANAPLTRGERRWQHAGPEVPPPVNQTKPRTPMKHILLALLAIALCTACEQRSEPAAGGGEKTTIITPGGGDAPKTENNTTVIAPTAPSPAEKSESSTTVVTPAAPATESKTESSTTTTTKPE